MMQAHSQWLFGVVALFLTVAIIISRWLFRAFGDTSYIFFCLPSVT
jgi:hypothetical protein